MKIRTGRKPKWCPELGFAVRVRLRSTMERSEIDTYANRFAAEAIEKNALICGGISPNQTDSDDTGFTVLIVKQNKRASCTNRDRMRVKRWCDSQRETASVDIGPLVATESDHSHLDQPPHPRPSGKSPQERALSLRSEAVELFRNSAAILGRKEVREAEQEFIRAVELAQSSVDEMSRALFKELGIPLRVGREKRNQRDISSFLDHYLGVITHPTGRRRRYLNYTPLQRALCDVTSGLASGGDGVIHIPDMHEVERDLVGSSRVAIAELQKLLSAPASSQLGKQLAQAVALERATEKKVRPQFTKRKKPEWPQTRIALLTGRSEARIKAVLAAKDTARTIISERDAKACEADVLPVEISVYLQKYDADGYHDLKRSKWTSARLALIWIAVPRTKWKAPVLAAVVPTSQCPIPLVGEDWFEAAVSRPHERGE